MDNGIIWTKNFIILLSPPFPSLLSLRIPSILSPSISPSPSVELSSAAIVSPETLSSFDLIYECDIHTYLAKFSFLFATLSLSLLLFLSRPLSFSLFPLLFDFSCTSRVLIGATMDGKSKMLTILLHGMHMNLYWGWFEICSRTASSPHTHLVRYISLIFRRVSLLQPTSPKFQDFAEQVRERAASVYNYTFSENEEVQTPIPRKQNPKILIASRLLVSHSHTPSSPRLPPPPRPLNYTHLNGMVIEWGGNGK